LAAQLWYLKIIYGTGVPEPKQGLRGVPQVSSMHMLFSVKMKTTKKMMVAALLTIAVLSVGITPIFAAPDTMSRGVTDAQKGRKNSFTAVNSQGLSVREQVKQRLQAFSAQVNITELDEADIDDKFAEVEATEPIEDAEGSVVWYLNARGMSIPTDPVTEEANPQEPLGLQLIAEKVKVTDFGVLYKVLWGRVHHTGEKVDIEGYAILDSDGIFYMKLNGEDLSYKAIGKIAPAGIGVRVVMKGYMTHDGESYSFRMHGRAIPLRGNIIKARVRNHLKNNEDEQGNRPTVTPNAAPS
jgi:hypothetical protein